MENRYDFVYLFDVKDGNPNGDPDAGNLPRIDAETGQGLVTDVCIKRKIRNYVGLVKEEQPPFEIYVKEKAILNKQHERSYIANKIKPDAKKIKEEETRKITDWMCQNFYDIRTFGAVMTTKVNCGQVRGAVQFAIARSIDPIVTQEHAITRCAVTTEKESEKQSGGNRTMGRKFTVPYGLYRIHGFINPHLASQTGFDSENPDLDLFWEALEKIFDFDRAAARGEMAAQDLIIFKHESPLGNAPAHRLFDRVKISRNGNNGDEGDTGNNGGGCDWTPPRSFSDYQVDVDEADLPEGISIIRKIS